MNELLEKFQLRTEPYKRELNGFAATKKEEPTPVEEENVELATTELRAKAVPSNVKTEVAPAAEKRVAAPVVEKVKNTSIVEKAKATPVAAK